MYYVIKRYKVAQTDYPIQNYSKRNSHLLVLAKNKVSIVYNCILESINIMLEEGDLRVTHSQSKQRIPTTSKQCDAENS